MNPLTKVKLINELNDREAKLGVKDSVSWHQDYKDSAWIFMGGLPFELTEGDVICVFSQYGEVVNINLVRDKQSGRSRGFCFLCYEDQRSTVLAIDNLNGIKLKGRTIRVDHVSNYRPPKDSDDIDEITKTLRDKGCGAQVPSSSSSEEEPEDPQRIKKHKKKKQKKESRERSNDRSARIAETIKQERADPAYEKYNTKQTASRQDRDQKKTSDKESSASSSATQPAYDRYKAEEKRHMTEPGKNRDMTESKHRDHEEKRHMTEGKYRNQEEKRHVTDGKYRDYEEKRHVTEGKYRDYEEKRHMTEGKYQNYEEKRSKELKRKR